MSEEKDIFQETEAEPAAVVTEVDEDEDLAPFKTADYVKLPFRETLFPSIFRENLITAPMKRKVPIMLSLFSPLGAIDCRIRMAYPYDRKRRHACHVQVVFEAPPSTGK